MRFSHICPDSSSTTCEIQPFLLVQFATFVRISLCYLVCPAFCDIMFNSYVVFRQLSPIPEPGRLPSYLNKSSTEQTLKQTSSVVEILQHIFHRQFNIISCLVSATSRLFFSWSSRLVCHDFFNFFFFIMSQHFCTHVINPYSSKWFLGLSLLFLCTGVLYVQKTLHVIRNRCLKTVLAWREILFTKAVLRCLCGWDL